MSTLPLHIRIDGTLDYRENKRHLPYEFSVPRGATALNIKFDYEPKKSAGQANRNDLSLTLFDPEGARGARHNNADRNLRITAQTATPGYTPGALQAGTWTVWIDTHRVLPPDEIRYWFEIDVTDGDVDDAPQEWLKGVTAARGAGWYRGDLHGHTWHSDARWDVPDFVGYARSYGLDFVTLTDHNTVSALSQLDSYGDKTLLTMGGEELTTYYGHALALGTRQWMEWRISDDVTMPMLAEQVQQAGALFIIAHPMSDGDPICTGCDWQYDDMMPGNARCVEIWNGPWAGESHNDLALELWYRWLNQGYRMAATTGTDIHGPLNDPAPGFDIVYAEELSEQAILRAVKAGHLYLSVKPRLDLIAENNSGERVMMGDVIGGEDIQVVLRWSFAEQGDQLRFIVNGEVTETTSTDYHGDRRWALPEGTRWCTVELRDAAGEMRAIANPIFVAGEWR